MEQQKTYNVAIFPPPGGIEVKARDYDDVDPCPTCNRPGPNEQQDRLDAAHNEGRAFGAMLSRYGSSEFRRGLWEALQEDGYLRKRGLVGHTEHCERRTN